MRWMGLRRARVGIMLIVMQIVTSCLENCCTGKVKDGLRSVLVVLNAIWFKRIYYLILMFKFFLRIFNKWNFSKLRFYYERMKMMWRKNQGKNLEYVTILFQWINIFLNIFPRLNIHYFNVERNLRTFANKKKGKKRERERKLMRD